MQNGNFEYDELTLTGYLSLHKAWEKIEFELGARIENTSINGFINLDNGNEFNTLPKSFLNVFPTAYFLYTPKDNHDISLSYGRRISRPGYSSLNPFRSYRTPFVYEIGNPYLRPTYINEFQLDYTLKNKYYFGLIFTNFENRRLFIF